jgi:hypothetical protein
MLYFFKNIGAKSVIGICYKHMRLPNGKNNKLAVAVCLYWDASFGKIF